MAPATIYECHDEIDETSVSNQTDTQPAENTTIAESVDFFSKRTITKAVKPKPKNLYHLSKFVEIYFKRRTPKSSQIWIKASQTG